MFDSTPTTTPTGLTDQDLHQEFLDNPNLFPEITDPKEREEAVLGFEQYLKIIDDIFMDQLRDGRWTTLPKITSFGMRGKSGLRTGRIIDTTEE